MRDPFEFPKLRWPLEINMQEHQGESVLVLVCPMGVSPRPLALVPAVAPIIREFTGDRSQIELLALFSGQGLTPELLQELIQLLEQNLYLESPAYFKAEKEMKAGYLSAPVRRPALAGLSYAGEESALRKQLRGFIGNQPFVEMTGSALVGLVAPHIDYRRGGSAYGKAYGHLQNFEHDLYLILGTSHQYSPHLFHLSAKNFETPLGILPCDAEFVHTLAHYYGEERSFADEILHKKEHSLELQTPFLQLIHSGRTIVPLLIGSFYDMLRKEKLPSEFEVYERFIDGLTIAVAHVLASGRRVLPIASVDMAHVGQYFGDAEKLTPERMEMIRIRDMQYLDTILAQDKQALFEHIAEDFDARKICGFPTMYLLLDLYDRLGISYSAQTFDYQQAVDYQSDCAVTFAAMGLYAE